MKQESEARHPRTPPARRHRERGQPTHPRKAPLVMLLGTKVEVRGKWVADACERPCGPARS